MYKMYLFIDIRMIYSYSYYLNVYEVNAFFKSSLF